MANKDSDTQMQSSAARAAMKATGMNSAEMGQSAEVSAEIASGAQPSALEKPSKADQGSSRASRPKAAKPV